MIDDVSTEQPRTQRHKDNSTWDILKQITVITPNSHNYFLLVSGK